MEHLGFTAADFVCACRRLRNPDTDNDSKSAFQLYKRGWLVEVIAYGYSASLSHRRGCLMLVRVASTGSLIRVGLPLQDIRFISRRAYAKS
jgi:hypothetical protein